MGKFQDKVSKNKVDLRKDTQSSPRASTQVHMCKREQMYPHTCEGNSTDTHTHIQGFGMQTFQPMVLVLSEDVNILNCVKTETLKVVLPLGRQCGG